MYKACSHTKRHVPKTESYIFIKFNQKVHQNVEQEACHWALIEHTHSLNDHSLNEHSLTEHTHSMIIHSMSTHSIPEHSLSTHSLAQHSLSTCSWALAYSMSTHLLTQYALLTVYRSSLICTNNVKVWPQNGAEKEMFILMSSRVALYRGVHYTYIYEGLYCTQILVHYREK